MAVTVYIQIAGEEKTIEFPEADSVDIQGSAALRINRAPATGMPVQLGAVAGNLWTYYRITPVVEEVIANPDA